MAQVVVELTGDEANLLKAYQKLERKHADMERQLKDLAAQARVTASTKESVFKRSFGAVADSAKSTVTGMVAQYIGFQAAIGTVNAYLKDQNKLLEEARDLQLNMAGSQQEAMKNLTGLSSDEKRMVVETLAPQLALDTGFGDLAKITDALGAGASAAGGDVVKASAATDVGARLTRQTPDALAATVSGLIDLSNATGSNDMFSNAGMALQIGGLARLEDPTKLISLIAPAASNVASSAPAGIDRIGQVEETGALFAALSIRAADKKGETTATFVDTLAAKLGMFFKDRKDDPGELFKRLEMIQSNADINAAFKKDAGEFGEAKFKLIVEDLLSGSSEVMQAAKANMASIDFSRTEADRAIREGESGTGAMIIANARRELQGNLQVQKFQDFRSGMLGEMSGDTDEVLYNTRRDGFFGGGGLDFGAEWLDYTTRNLGGFQINKASTVAGSRDALLLQSIVDRRDAITSDGVTPSEAGDLRTIDALIKTIQQQLTEMARHESLGTGGINQGTTQKIIDDLRSIDTGRETGPKIQEIIQSMADAVSRDNKANQESVELLRKINATLEKQRGPTPQQASQRGGGG